MGWLAYINLFELGVVQLLVQLVVTNDVIPFGLVQGPRGSLDGLNLMGLKERVLQGRRTALRAAFQTLEQDEGTFQDKLRS